MSRQTKAWLLQWLKKRNPGAAIDENADFYEKGLVDSLGIIELIEAVEDNFAIRLGENELNQPSFRTIDGLTRIIEESTRKT